MKKLTICVFGLSLISTQAAPTGGFSFEQMLQRHDSNKDGVITREEFHGPAQLFSRLDLDQDGQLTQKEFIKIQALRKNSSFTARKAPDGVRVLRDLEFAEVDGQALRLDLYLPEENTDGDPPLIVWIHGGGWRNGDKANVNPAILRLSGDGYAVASINYRLKDLSIHPKHIHDCKGAVRRLRAHADEYGFDASRIAVAGSSAGGHLALLLGLSGNVEHLEGTVGGNLEYAGPVQAIVDLYGPADLPHMAENSKRLNTTHTFTEEQILDASPLEYLSSDDPPVLVFHGDNDQTVPVEQSRILQQRYEDAGLSCELHILPGAGHGGPQFSDDTRYQLIKEFLDSRL